MSIRLQTCALLVPGALSLIGAASKRNGPIGSYTLAAAGDRHPPLYLGGGFNGEGASLDSVFLMVQARGRFTARVVASWRDSGTVARSRTTTGNWHLEGSSIVFNYANVVTMAIAGTEPVTIPLPPTRVGSSRMVLIFVDSPDSGRRC